MRSGHRLKGTDLAVESGDSENPPMKSIHLLAILLLLPAGCSQDSSTSEGATPVAAPQVVSIEYAGMYEVTGVTSVDGSDIERELELPVLGLISDIHPS